jgi:hypothetical protein
MHGDGAFGLFFVFVGKFPLPFESWLRGGSGSRHSQQGEKIGAAGGEGKTKIRKSVLFGMPKGSTKFSKNLRKTY